MEAQISNRCKILISKSIADSLSEEEQTELNEYLISNSFAKQYQMELKYKTNMFIPECS